MGVDNVGAAEVNEAGSPVHRLDTMLENKLEVAFQLSRLLAGDTEVAPMLQHVLATLDEKVGLSRGLVAIANDELTEVKVAAVRGEPDWDPEWLNKQVKGVRFKSGEGIIGRILASGEDVVLGRIASEPMFLHKLDIYELELPFIGIPIKGADGVTVGVLAAQPKQAAVDQLSDQTRFMRMIANIIFLSLRLDKDCAPSPVPSLAAGETSTANQKNSSDQFQREKRSKYSFDKLVVGRSETMHKVFDQVKRVGKWDSTVLIRGESGTGKELIACAIHYNSPRSSKPFIKLNCAALPENLLESELFGHEKGAFTGAIKQRQGRFEQADGGTLFLDEIGEISPMFQAKLLRVLQESELERVGGNQTIKVNVRIVAATNRNLEADVEEGSFREDLYYRLNVMPILLPPLRERLVDIPELAEFLVGKIAKQQNRELRITEGAIRTLMGYHWPGNVRELENCLERAAVMCEQNCIDLDVISLSGIDREALTPARVSMPEVDLNDQNLDERERVTAALEQAGWVQARAARLLGMTPRQIAYRIQTLNIRMRKI